ncbi:MAG: SUMF1/EgtB/PvdO family nonheme iron enzyme [Candidatus Fermentibacteraceae bacterium]
MKPSHLLLLLGILGAFLIGGLFALDFFPTHRAVVVTVPRGALVSVGGAPPMTSPFSVPVHMEGTMLTISREGFRPVDTTLTPGADTIVVYLERLCGIAVFTEPAGLTVSWEGFSSMSPCTIPLPGPGSYEIHLTGENGISDRVSLTLLTPELVTLTRQVPVFIPGNPPMVRVPGSHLHPGSSGFLAGVNEVTVREFTLFLNGVDPDLERTGWQRAGRTVLTDSILRCNWPLPVVANLDSGRYETVSGMEDLPMHGMNQAGAEMYCRWLTGASGNGLSYRLPEPEEWRLAAGAGGRHAPAVGTFNCSDSSEGILNRHPDVEDGFEAASPVGTYPANPWGLYDTAGNLWEWTASPGIAAGGSWLSSIEDCGPGSLAQFSPELGYPFVGFRVFADENTFPGD